MLHKHLLGVALCVAGLLVATQSTHGASYYQDIEPDNSETIEVELDAIQCWWKVNRNAVRIGESLFRKLILQ